MTQEKKQLLLKDLCARLPYGVKFQGEDSNVYTLDAANYFVLQVEDMVFKPYLRPMSSMTAEEENFYYSCLDEMDGYKQTFPVIYQDKALSLLDFLNANHFDYHGLIPMGIALEAPEGMYKTE